MTAAETAFFSHRQRARTDLLWLCHNVLGYKDVDAVAHKPILDNLQKFEGWTETLKDNKLVGGPRVPLWELKGSRSNLFLYPRGHLKTTVITIAHTIQWIINYPDIRVLLSMATGDQVTKVMTEIRGHFQFNLRFRTIFLDFCPPPRAAAEFGTKEEFTIPNRTRTVREPTVSVCTIGKVIAGSHYEVIKNSDLVDENNVLTPGQVAATISHFGYMDPLVERSPIPPHHGWQDVEGTPYDHGDLYAVLRAAPDWNVVARGARGEPGNDTGTTLWPARWPEAELDRIKRKPEVSAYIYSCQYLVLPISPEGGLCQVKDIMFLPRHVISNIYPTLRLHCTVDLAGMEPDRASTDFTVLTVGGFDRDGRLYIIDIRRGRYSPHEVIEHMFDIYRRYPRLIDIKIEKDAHARVLLPFFYRECSKRNLWPSVIPLKRDNQRSKQHRIRGLQPWFKAHTIRFADDIPCKVDLTQEVMRFPSTSRGVTDDILDTLADQLQNEEGGAASDVLANPEADLASQFGRPRAPGRFIGFGIDGEEMWTDGTIGAKEVISKTGIL